jgi:hypothetical protein
MRDPCIVLTTSVQGREQGYPWGANSLDLVPYEANAGSYWFKRHCLWCGRLRQSVRELFCVSSLPPSFLHQ